MTELKTTLADDRYTITEKLAQSSFFGELFHAVDRESQRSVMLLQLPQHVVSIFGPDKIESRVPLFADPELPMFQVKDLFTSSEGMSVVYERIEGALPLLDYLAGKSLPAMIEVFRKLAEAIATLHKSTLWHGGIVPEHVWVLPNGEVRLMIMLTPSPLRLYSVCGASDAMNYFSPETMATDSHDARTDIYNLGVLFYYLLTGSRYPFGHANEENTVNPPSRYNQHIPPQLDRMVLKMINRKPSKRFQWIGQIIDELTRMLGSRDSTYNAVRKTFGAQYLFTAEFTGRIDESDRLSEFYESLIAGQPYSLLLTGLPGVGRRRLIYEVFEKYMFNVSGMSTTVVSQSSYATVEKLIVRLLNICLSKPNLESLAHEYMKPLSLVLPRVAQEFREMLASSNETIKEKIDGERIMLEFFSKAIEYTEEPYVIELYDLHLLDTDSIEFFKQLKKLASSKQLVLALIGVSDELTDELEEIFDHTMHIFPQPLEEVRDIVMSRFGDADFLSSEFMQWLNHHARGSLGQVFKMVEYLADTEQIYLERYAWHMVTQSVEKLNIPESMEALILYRLEQLPPQAKELYEVMSLFKGSFHYEAIAKAAHLESLDEAMKLMASLEEQGLLLLQKDDEYRFPSNNLKEHVQRTIPEANRKELHKKIADCLIDVGAVNNMEIAYHFEMGEEWKKAIFMYITGAKRSYKGNMLRDAELQIRKSIELYEQLPGRRPPNTLYLMRARCLKLSGRLEEAGHVYDELYARSHSLRVLITLAMNYVNIGHYHKIKPYVPYMREVLDTDIPSVKLRLSLMAVLGMYYIENEGNYEFIKELEAYQQKKSAYLREHVHMKDYVSWLYNLQVLLLYVPGTPFEQRARYLHEAATLAEHHNFQLILIGINNSIAIGLQETDPLKAKDYYLASAKLAAELEDKSKETIAYINLIEIYRMLGDMYHSHRYIEKARETGALVNKQDDSYLLQNEIEHFMFIEDYLKAEQVIRKLVATSKATEHQKMRDYAFMYRFAIVCECGQTRRADRMWPLVELICQNRQFTVEHQFMRARYFLLKDRNEEVIDEFTELINESGVPTEARIRRHFYLLDALLKEGRWNEGLEIAQAVQKLIHNTGYVGFLARAHYYLGRLYQLTHQFVHANLNYKRAMMWYRKLNQQTRLSDIDRLMRQTNQEMIKAADTITEDMVKDVQEVDELVANRVSEGGVRLKDWARSIVKERQEMIDTLTDNEILLDAIRRVSSSIMVKTVCENLAAVVFENLLFDHIHLYIKIADSRVELIHLNEQLQEVHHTEGEVDRLIANVIETQRPLELEGRYSGSYLYGIPVFSHDQQVIAVMVLEKMSLQTPFTTRDKRFINNFAQLVSSNVENAILYEVMITDNLTGLYTRNYFMKRVEEEFNKIQRYGIDLSFLMIDLDNFSRINNAYGHNEGDRVLRTVAQTLLKSVRNVDIVGRFGGEEIIVILPNTNGSAARIVAERILNNLRNMPVEGNRYTITASIGVASFDLDHPQDALDLIECADQAETYAKRNGKNRVVCHWELAELEKREGAKRPEATVTDRG